MKSKKLLGTLGAACLFGFGAAAHAQYSAIVSTAPPPPRHETAPAARSGWIWAPGHYEVRGNDYAWIEGSWMRDRSGYEYREPRWVQRGDGRWAMVGGNWERRGPNGDRDGDGVANRHDPDNRRFGPRGDLDRDGIANRNDRDRDGDGVRNNRDRFPDNPRRS